MNEMEKVRRIKTIIEKIGRVKVDELPFCSKTMYWQINKFYTKSTERSVLKEMLAQHFGEGRKIRHGQYAVQRLGGEIAVIYGNFSVTDEENTSGFYSFPYEMTAMMKNGIMERMILTGNRTEQVLCMVKHDEDHIYMLKESEVLYIESSHNNVIWHCQDTEVTNRGTLKALETQLPSCFFRLQRGYIVNAYHIKSMEEKEITMDNGDTLMIPIRHYYEVRKKIGKYCEALAEMPERYERWNWLNIL